MGGFAGGDEAGYWDVEQLSIPTNPLSLRNTDIRTTIELLDSNYCIKAYAKHIVLKENQIYWLRSSDLYDTICFVPTSCNVFTVEGYPEQASDNPISRAYHALQERINEPELEEFFHFHKVVIIKRIPPQQDFSGNASNIASFLCMAKEVCNLILSIEELVEIAASIDSDCPFFICNYSAVMVSEDGKIVEVLEK